MLNVAIFMIVLVYVLPAITGNEILFSFVRCILFEGDQVEHFPHPAPHPFPVPFFQFVRIEVRRSMGLDAVLQEEFVPREQDLPDHVAVLAEMPADRLYPEVVETVKAVVAIIPDDLVADVVETEGDVARRDDLIWPDVRNYVSNQLHDRGLPASDRAGEQYALVRVNA